MKCPHCLNSFFSNPQWRNLQNDINYEWTIEFEICPTCQKIIIYLINFTKGSVRQQIDKKLIFPTGINRNPVPKEVPEKYSNDFIEACLVFTDCPKASAALSRRCLQNIIREELKITKKDMNSEIVEVIKNKLFPSDILESIDAIRNIGNFAAHPIKSQSSGEIVEVEPNEAEWNLDVLEMIFDYLFVRPALVKQKGIH
jgi:hypothetical protein